jgi:hypothetical protein
MKWMPEAMRKHVCAGPMTHKPDSRYHVTRMHSASVNTTSIVIATTASLISTVLENI